MFFNVIKKLFRKAESLDISDCSISKLIVVMSLNYLQNYANIIFPYYKRQTRSNINHLKNIIHILDKTSRAPQMILNQGKKDYLPLIPSLHLEINLPQ